MTDICLDTLFDDVRRLIDTARAKAIVAVNAELTLMYWHIGRRIHRDVLGGTSAEYGQTIVIALACSATIILSGRLTIFLADGETSKAA